MTLILNENEDILLNLCLIIRITETCNKIFIKCETDKNIVSYVGRCIRKFYFSNFHNKKKRKNKLQYVAM